MTTTLVWLRHSLRLRDHPALVDADLASNTFNWQWTAGAGADA
jgi:deoxyribodipyrimidine photolyase